ncbi:PlsC domain-containing protein [Aphelenchoides besseyi]|nr:PlsC domain-containing protein [Aphelenchoides besseyi]KAI6209358.1 PlsC domain-containing protein [Aphelenchoides besseyi]
MFWFLLSLYLYFQLFIFTTTVFLIFCGLSWGRAPHFYLYLIEQLQKQYEAVYPPGYFDRVPWTDLIDADERHSFLHPVEGKPPANFEIVREDFSSNLFDMPLELARSGVECIVQDQLTAVFNLAPAYQRNRLNFQLWRLLKNRPGLRILWILSTCIRFLFILPIRVLLFTSSFLFVISMCLIACVIEFSDSTKTRIGVIYCRLYTAGTGLVAEYKDVENRPQRPGITVANHLSPNDLMVICADVDPNRDYLYTVTGQQHNGIIWLIETLAQRLCDAVWLERTSAESRKQFMQEVLARAKAAGPVILFPEGYCTNNIGVLQFRRAVFERDINIYPIAIRQNARFGDSYWFEDTISTYYLRQLSSWASVYEVFYLPVQQMRENESSEEFAARVRKLIAAKIGIRTDVGELFDGGVYYKQRFKEKYKGIIQKNLAADLVPSGSSSPTLTNETSSTYGGY